MQKIIFSYAKSGIIAFLVSILLVQTNGLAQKTKLESIKTVPVFENFKPYRTPVDFKTADKRADSILSLMSIPEKIEMLSGHDLFFTKGYEKYKIPQFFFSDATQGIRIQKDLDPTVDKSTAFPCPLALTATWNPSLANKYAQSIGEECRLSNVAVLLGPGMNIYRISQNGRNFEYFGEDPFLAARMVEQYVVGMQSTGTITTLKHFLCNNSDFHRRRSNSVVDDRAIHEIYLPAFKAGVDAGALAVMTAYNQLNGEWTGQSEYLINKLLRNELGFNGMVMTDWWSVYDPEKVIKSGSTLDMPGHAIASIPDLKELGDVYIKTNALRLLTEGKISETDINRMTKTFLRTFISMGMLDRSVRDNSFKQKFDEHEKVALQTAREAIVLLRNEKNLLPLKAKTAKNILVTGKYVEQIAQGLGSAKVEGFNTVKMIDALRAEFGANVEFVEKPTDLQIKNASAVLISIGSEDSEGWDKSFDLPIETENQITSATSLNKNVIVVVNTGGGIKMSNWNTKVSSIIYAWYVGQNGYHALAEILSGKTNPSGKLPITIEKKFEDSPGANYIPAGDKLYTGWEGDYIGPKCPVFDVEYKEGIFVGYRWYEAKKIEPLYPFGFGLSYTQFEFSKLQVTSNEIENTGKLTVQFEIKNTGKSAGADVAQLYIQSINPSVERPVKELKSFAKIELKAGESKSVSMTIKSKDFARWDSKTQNWKVDDGYYNLLLGSSSINIKQTIKVKIQTAFLD